MTAVTTTSAITSPPLLQSARELRVVWEALASLLTRRPARHAKPRDSRLVLVIPGFLATDASTWPLRRYLSKAGFHVHPWDLGMNRGPCGDTVARLARRIRQLSRESGEAVQLVGWSLGGLLARVAAARARRYVSRVVALGSPLSGDPGCTRLGPLFRMMSGRDPEDRLMKRTLRHSFEVPVVSVYSRSDGVVGWQASAYPGGQYEAIEVRSSHLGMVLNAEVLDAVGRVLARPAAAFTSDATRLCA